MEKIGFIGLGIMGKPMSKHLLKAGYPVSVLSTSASVTELKSAGASSFDTPAQLASNCDVVITMLPDSPEVIGAMTGDNGILSGIKKGSLYIDMSSIDPSASVTIFGMLQAKNVEALDAPVSG